MSAPPAPNWPPAPYYGMDNNEQNHILLNSSIYNGTEKVLSGINDTNRFLATEVAGVAKNVSDSNRYVANGFSNVSKDVTDTARDILRAVDNTNSTGLATTERVGFQLSAAVDRNGNQNMSTTERANSQLGTALERNGGNIMTAIEKLAGEGRLTTTIVDAASRQAAADTARDILRTVDQNGAAGLSTSERIGFQLSAAVDRNGNQNMSTTERANYQLSNAVERNGGAIQTAIERVAGEGRITSATLDAASRQAAADSARDIMVSMERNGGESRAATLQASGTLGTLVTDVRHSVLNDINRTGNELHTASTQSLNVITKGIGDAAWETRSALNNGFTNTLVESMKSKEQLASQMSQQHALLTSELNQAKHHAHDHHTTLLLEQHKMKEYLSSKTDTHFAMNQLEMQKSKSELAQQASNHFAINQLEQQKIKEVLSTQMAEAKYEALKSQQLLADKICECCCEVKGKIDTIDRDRLRDNLSVANNDNNLLKVVELAQAVGGYGSYGGHGRRRRSRSRSRSRSRDRGDRR